MPKTPILNFSKGELGPQLWARIDASQYNAGAKRMRNVIAQRYGGAAARPGFRVIGELDDQTLPAKLVPFQYSIDQAYVLGMQQASARALAFGGFVLETNTKITVATQTNPIQITAPLHGYAVGDRVFFSGVTGMTQLNGRSGRVLTVPSADTMTLDIDARTFSAFTASDGTLNMATPPTPTPAPTPTPTPAPPPQPSTGGGGGNGTGVGGGRYLPRQYEEFQ
ncbi:MAG TPA: ubiquitin-activating E1 FCCH domain-containing protein [Sphingomonas sp.]|jgi:hypothetical protein